MQATELVVKNKKCLDEAGKMYREEVFENMKSSGRVENIYISGPSGCW